MPKKLYVKSLPLAGLSIKQLCILSFFIGIFYFRLPCAALTCFGLAILCALPRSFTLKVILLMLVSLSLGAKYVELRDIKQPNMPIWLSKTLKDEANKPNEYIKVKATIKDVKRLSLNRLQCIISNLTPYHNEYFEEDGAKELPKVDLSNKAAEILGRSISSTKEATEPKPNTAEAYTGNVLWSVSNKETSLIPGQEVIIEVRLSYIHGLSNPNTWDTEEYYRDSNIWLKAWSKNNSPVEVVSANTNIFAKIRLSMMSSFIDNLPKDSGYVSKGAGLLPALIFGDRSFISPDTSDLISKSTLAHSLALSGLHLGYALALGVFAAFVIGSMFPNLWLIIPRQQFCLLLGLPFAVLYLWLGDWTISLLRATCMVLFWSILVFLKKPKVILDGVIMAVFAIILINPLFIFDIRLQLSALSVITIACCLPWVDLFSLKLITIFSKNKSKNNSYLHKSFDSILKRMVKALFVMFCLSFSIQVVLYPIIAKTFGSMGLLFPLNLIWLPILGIMVMPFAFLGLLFSVLDASYLAKIFLEIASYPCSLLIDFLNFLDSNSLLYSPAVLRPHWLLSLSFWLLLLVIPIASNQVYFIIKNKDLKSVKKNSKDTQKNISSLNKKLDVLTGKSTILHSIAVTITLFCKNYSGIILSLLAIILASSSLIFVGNISKGVSLKLLDVGQGQAVLVEWSLEDGSGRILIDAGESYKTGFDMGKAVVVPSISYNSFPYLDWLLISHPDKDHLGGAPYILKSIPVNRYATSPVAKGNKLQEKVNAILSQQNIELNFFEDGDSIVLANNLSIEILWPTKDTSFNSYNEGSLVTLLIWNNKPLALICGDIEGKNVETLITHHKNYLKADVLILPHHGSYGSYSTKFYKLVSPKVALASSGYKNRWNFPSDAIIRYFNKTNTNMYSTAVHGQISINWEKLDNNFKVSLSRNLPTLSKAN